MARPRRSGIAHELKSWRWERDQEPLRTHLIDEAQFARLQQGRVDEFLRIRKGEVEKLVANFFSQRAAWDQPDLRPLEAYLEQLTL